MEMKSVLVLNLLCSATPPPSWLIFFGLRPLKLPTAGGPHWNTIHFFSLVSKTSLAGEFVAQSKASTHLVASTDKTNPRQTQAAPGTHRAPLLAEPQAVCTWLGQTLPRKTIYTFHDMRMSIRCSAKSPMPNKKNILGLPWPEP